MKRLALAVALVALGACAKEQAPASGTMADTTKKMADTTHMMMADTAKKMADTTHMKMADTSKKMAPAKAPAKKP